MFEYTVKLELTQGDIERFYDEQARLEQERRADAPTDIGAALAVFHRELLKCEPRPDGAQYAVLVSEFGGLLRAARARETYAPVKRGLLLRAAQNAQLLTLTGAITDLPPWAAAQIETAIGEAIQRAFTVPNA